MSTTYDAEVFKLAQTREVGQLSEQDLAAFIASLGRSGPMLGLAVALHRGEGCAALAAKYRDVGAFDWSGADQVLAKKGPQEALAHLLLSGDPRSNPKADLARPPSPSRRPGVQRRPRTRASACCWTGCSTSRSLR